VNDLSAPPVPLTAWQVAKNLVGWLFILVTCVGMGPFVVLIMFALFPFGKAPAFGDWVVWWWTAFLKALWGVKIEVDGLEHVEPGRPYVLVSNHRSHLDPVSTIHGLRSKMRFGFVMKRSLSLIPIWGWFIWLNGYVPIDRGTRGKGGKGGTDQLDVPARYIRRGRSVMMYPEGHRAPDHRFLPFKKGAVVLALKAGVPLLPVVVSGTGRLWPKTSLMIRPGTVKVEVLPPIPTEGVSPDDRDRLLDALKSSIPRRYRLLPHAPPAEHEPALLADLTKQIGRRDRPDI
jgi:1-acyl-sn-glycerol-3-phosphate acyltransferase